MSTESSYSAGGDAEIVELCDDAGTFLRRLLLDASGNIIGSTDLTLAGAPYVPVGPVTGCADPTATLDATVQRQTGAGTVTITGGARSVTVVALVGPVTVNLGQGVTTIPTGVTLTWAVDGVGETLAEAFAFTGVVGSDFIVTSTRQ